MGQGLHTFDNGVTVKKNVYDNLIRASEIFQTNVFTCKDIQNALGVSKSCSESLVRRGIKGGVIFELAKKRDFDDLFDSYDIYFAAVYSFDKNRDFADAVNYFNLEPIPSNQITLDVQLLGETYKRYLDVRNQHIASFNNYFEE